jgi:ribonuclease HII
MRHEALALFEQGIKLRYELDVVIGIDEAGRGSLAGPVFAGACAITDPQNTTFINDSKLLSPRQREQAFEALPAHAVFATGSASAAEIDALGILGATFQAMERALTGVLPAVRERWGMGARIGVVVDGSLLPPFLEAQDRLTSMAIIDADASVLSVAGASIAAKVVRDGVMRQMARRIHGYGFEGNVGYGTREHIEALRARGPSPEHRRTFVVKQLQPQAEELPLEHTRKPGARKRR